MIIHKDKFINEVKRRIKIIFNASKEGCRVSSMEKHRVEGFMQAGVFLGIVSNEELYGVMQKEHISIRIHGTEQM